MLQKSNDLKRLISKQSEWVRQQQSQMSNINKKFNHLIHILNNEIVKEHQREFRLLSLNNTIATSHTNKNNSVYTQNLSKHEKLKHKKKISIEIWTERYEAANRILDTLLAYNLLSESEEADFILSCLRRWRKDTKKIPKDYNYYNNDNQITNLKSNKSSDNSRSNNNNNNNNNSDEISVQTQSSSNSSYTEKKNILTEGSLKPKADFKIKSGTTLSTTSNKDFTPYLLSSIASPHKNIAVTAPRMKTKKKHDSTNMSNDSRKILSIAEEKICEKNYKNAFRYVCYIYIINKTS